jgi:hypothetical protein
MSHQAVRDMSLVDEEPDAVAAEPARNEIAVGTANDRTLITAAGDVRARAQELSNTIQHLDPFEHPRITLDLRDANSIDPLVVHALLRAWEHRDRAFGCVRVLTGPGDVARYLHGLRLEHALDLQHPHPPEGAPEITPAEWEIAQIGTIQHYRELLQAAQQRDLPRFERLARLAHPVCEVSGAPGEGPAVGHWCTHCPLAQVYGGCQPLLDQMIRAAHAANWEAAQMLVLALIAETAGTED